VGVVPKNGDFGGSSRATVKCPMFELKLMIFFQISGSILAVFFQLLEKVSLKIHG